MDDGSTGIVTLAVPLGRASGGTGLSTIGSDGTILKAVSGAPAWSTCSPQATTYTTGSGNFTIPAGVTNLKITVIGAGGGGGGAGSNGAAMGGGAGGMAIKWLTGLTPGATCAYAVGAAGSGGAAGNNAGSAGGNTTITVGATTYTGAGGAGGTNQNDSSQTGCSFSAGGTATNGDLNITGDPGTPYYTGYVGSVTTLMGGQGGKTSYGACMGVVQFSSPTTGKAGQNATGYGAGGGGAITWTGSTFAGGNGAGGLIIIEY